MDLRLFLGVLRRFRLMLAVSFVVALALAIFSYGSPGFAHGKPTIIPRGSETWQSEAELLITQASFPAGRVGTAATASTSLASLAPIYAAFASGDSVQASIRASHIPGSLQASANVDEATGSGLPLVTLTATGPTAKDATTIAARATALLNAYVIGEQVKAGIAAPQRVELQVVQTGAPATLAAGHKLTLPLMVFVAMFGAAVALAFALENVRPATAARLGRVPPIPGTPMPQVSGTPMPQVPGTPMRHISAGRVARMPSSTPVQQLGSSQQTQPRAPTGAQDSTSRS